MTDAPITEKLLPCPACGALPSPRRNPIEAAFVERATEERVAKERDEARETLVRLVRDGDERMTWARSRGFDLATISELVGLYVAEECSIGYLVEQLRLLAFAAREEDVKATEARVRAELAEDAAKARAWERMLPGTERDDDAGARRWMLYVLSQERKRLGLP